MYGDDACHKETTHDDPNPCNQKIVVRILSGVAQPCVCQIYGIQATSEIGLAERGATHFQCLMKYQWESDNK